MAAVFEGYNVGDTCGSCDFQFTCEGFQICMVSGKGTVEYKNSKREDCPGYNTKPFIQQVENHNNRSCPPDYNPGFCDDDVDCDACWEEYLEITKGVIHND